MVNRPIGLPLAQAWTALRRHGIMTLAAVVNIAVSLWILASFFLATANLEHIADLQAREAIITIYLAEDAERVELESRLFGDLRVKELTFVSQDDALREYSNWTGLPYEGLQKAFEGKNPLPNLLRIKVNEPEELEGVAELARSLDGVDRVSYHEDVARRILSVARGIRILGMVTGGVMALAALMLVGTTIGLTVHARRREIRIMQLVGATNWFIRAPFLIEGAIEGLAGGIVAAVLVLAGYSYVNIHITRHLAFIELMYDLPFLVLLAAGTIIGGILFGVIGSLVGTKRYLKLI